MLDESSKPSSRPGKPSTDSPRDVATIFGHRRALRRHPIALVGSGIALTFVGLAAWGSVTAFHSADYLFTLSSALLLMEGFVVSISYLRPTTRSRIQQMPVMGRLVVGANLIVFLAVVPAVVALWLNQVFDTSRGVYQRQTVREKWIRGSKYGRTCVAGVIAEAPRRPFIRFPWSSDVQPIVLPCSLYRVVVPGRTELAFDVHAGAIGVPWYGLARVLDW